MLELNTSNCTPFLPKDWLTSRLDALESARVKLEEGSGLGGAYTGWVHLPRDYDKEEFARIKAAAEKSSPIPTYSLSLELAVRILAPCRD